MWKWGTKSENWKILLHLEITKVVLVYFNIVKNYYQHYARVLHIFVLNKLLGQLLDTLPKTFTVLETFNSKFSYIEVWFTDQNSKPLETEDKRNITLVIN